MAASGNTIAKNAAALFTAQLITWVLALLLTIFTPRYLGPHGFGVLTLAFSVWSVAGVIAMWGIDTFLIKAIARQPAQAASLIKIALLVRTGLFGVASLCVGLYAWSQQYPAETLIAIGVIGISTLLNSYSGVLYAGLQGLELMSRTSLVTILSKAFTTIVGIVVLLLGFGLYGLTWVIVAASLVSVLGHFYFLWGRRSTFTERGTLAGMGMLRASSPYLMSALILTTYGRIDVLIMAPLLETKVLGWYSAAMALYGTLLFMPTILSTAIFPAMARSHTDGTQRAKSLMSKSFDLTFLIAVPIGLGLAVISDGVIALLFGPEFAPSAQVLALMGGTLIFMYQNIVIGQFLISIDRQNTWTIVMALGVALTIVLDLILVPWFQRTEGNGAIGAAVSYIITESLMFGAGIILLPRGLLGWTNIGTAARTLLAGLLMALCCWWARDLFIAIPIGIGVVVYVGAVLLLQIVPAEDLVLLKGIAADMVSRLQNRFRSATSRSVS